MRHVADYGENNPSWNGIRHSAPSVHSRANASYRGTAFFCSLYSRAMKRAASSRYSRGPSCRTG